MPIQQPLNINPIDLRKDVAVGIALPFNLGSIFTLNYTTKDQIKTNLINYFLTNKGERVLNPEFGADLRSLIFSQISDVNIELLNEIITGKINDNFPSINILELNFLRSPENEHTIILYFKYNIKNIFTEPDTITINFT